jgi:hypothetical protein
LGSAEFPNNTSALALGNLSNIQQLQKHGIQGSSTSKPKKILILKQKRKNNAEGGGGN